MKETRKKLKKNKKRNSNGLCVRLTIEWARLFVENGNLIFAIKSGRIASIAYTKCSAIEMDPTIALPVKKNQINTKTERDSTNWIIYCFDLKWKWSARQVPVWWHASCGA